VQGPAQRAAVQHGRMVQGGLFLQRRPGMDGVLALLDAGEARPHQLHRG